MLVAIESSAATDIPPVRKNERSAAVVCWHNRPSRYNRSWAYGTLVGRLEMPKWIMRLMPDVPLGAEVWVIAASRSAGFRPFSRHTPRMHVFKLLSPMESEASW